MHSRVKTEAAPAEAAGPCVTSRAALARIFTPDHHNFRGNFFDSFPRKPRLNFPRLTAKKPPQFSAHCLKTRGMSQTLSKA
jgi:hypothetical protein